MKPHKRKKHLRFRYIEYITVLLLVKLFSVLPYKLGSDIGGIAGRLGYYVDLRHRRIALSNLKIAFPEEGEKRIAFIAKKAFENLGRSATEVIHIATRKAPLICKVIHNWITVEGRDNLDLALKREKGVILITAHFGNWEILGIATAAFGLPLNVIARPLDNLWIDRIITSMRSVTGARVIQKKGALRNILKGLKHGECVGILIDQNASRREGVFVDFFGHPASTNRGPALIAMKSGAPVIPFYIIREGRYRHRIYFGQEVRLQKSGDVERDAIENTGIFTKVIESYIKEFPGQWFWMHQRWKTRPK